MPFPKSYRSINCVATVLLAPLLQQTFLILREVPALKNRRYISNLETPRSSLIVVLGLFPPAKICLSKKKTMLALETRWPLISVSGKLEDYTTIQPTAETYKPCFEQHSNKSSGPGCPFMDKSYISSSCMSNHSRWVVYWQVILCIYIYIPKYI